MKKTYLSKVLFYGVMALGLSFTANAELQSYTASYYATFGSISGKNTSSLSKNPDTGEYTYSSYTKPRGIAALAGKIRESARFYISDGKVKPAAYSHKSRDTATIVYDWKNKKAQTNDDGSAKELSLAGNELDLLSLQMQLMEDLNNADLQASYTVIKGNDIKTYKLEKLGTEDVTIGSNTYTSIKLKQQREGSSRHTIMWLAPELQHVIVKMEQYKGEKLRGTLTMTGYHSTESQQTS